MNALHHFASSPSRADSASSPAQPVLRCVLDQRVQHLVDFYRHVQIERMQGLPILNPALAVEAIGFEWGDAEQTVAEGVLITPWFLSLVRLLTADAGAARVGSKRILPFCRECFEFIAAEGGPNGSIESCSLFSPMDEFGSQALAQEVALTVLAELRVPRKQVVATPAGSSPAIAMPSRRALLMGRRSV